MTADDILLSILPCAALPGTGLGRPAPERISLESLAFRSAGDPSVPRGHAVAEAAFRFGERCLRIEVDFGGVPTGLLRNRVDDVLASLVVGG